MAPPKPRNDMPAPGPCCTTSPPGTPPRHDATAAGSARRNAPTSTATTTTGFTTFWYLPRWRATTTNTTLPTIRDGQQKAPGRITPSCRPERQGRRLLQAETL